MVKIKICGLTRIKDIEIVNEVLPDFIGFVFAKSIRRVNYKFAKTLKENLNSSIKAVGVFVNEEIDTIVKLWNDKVIDIVQLHGDENEEYIMSLRQFISCPIIKAARVKEKDDIKNVSKLSCDYILLDAYHEDQYGGNGTTFDWNLISNINKPYFLGGGIHFGNILGAIQICKPYCIDVSSGVETDGLKDAHKIEELVSLIRKVSRYNET